MTKNEKNLKAQLNAAREEIRVDRLEIADLKERIAILTQRLKAAELPTPVCPFPEFDPIDLEKVEAAL